jgi:hypothetical protein
MEFPTHISQAFDQRLLNVHVDVFQFVPPMECRFVTTDLGRDLVSNLAQCVDDLSALVGSEQAHSPQHLGVCYRTLYIMRVQAKIETDTLPKGLNTAVCRRLKDP